MGEVEEFNTLTFEKRLTQLKDTQESIQALSSWCLRQREHHKKIVASWLNVLKRVKVEQRLVLFYLANDVIQYSKRKNFEFVESWGLYLQKATPLVRDEKVRHKILRIFKIWEQRAVYDDDFLSDLTGLLSAGAIKKTDDDPLDFQPQQLVNKIKQCTVLEADTDLRLKYIHESHLELSDADALCANLKDRSNKDDVEKELNEGIQCVERYTQALQREIVAREALLALLSTANQYYSTQRGEVKVVAYAYKNFGARVRALKRKLDELIPTLPSKVPSPPPREEDVPSPGPDEDLDLPPEELGDDELAYNIDRTFNTTITADGSMYNLGLSSFLSSENPMSIFNDSDASSANKIEVIGSRPAEKQSDFDINNFLKTLATGDSNPATSENSNSGGVKGDTLPGLDLLTEGPHPSHPPPPLSFYGSLNTHNDEPEVYHPEMTTRNQWSNQWSNPPAPVPPPMVAPPSMAIPVSIASSNQSHIPNNQSHHPNNQSHPTSNESYSSNNEYPSNTQSYTCNNQSYSTNTLSYSSNTPSYTSNNNQSIPLLNQSPPRNNQLIPPNNLLPPNNQLIPSNNQLLSSNNPLISSNNPLISSNNQLIPPSNKSLPIIDALSSFEPSSLSIPGSPLRTISPINPPLNNLLRARFDTPESPPPVPPPPPAPIVPVYTHNAELPPADVDHRGILPPPPPPPVLPLLGNLEDVDHRLLPPPPPAPPAAPFPPLYSDVEDVDHRPRLPSAGRLPPTQQDVDHRNLISLTSQTTVTPSPHLLSGDQDYRVPPLVAPSDIVESVDMDLSEDEEQQALFQNEHRRNSFNNNKVLVGGNNGKKKHNENHNLQPMNREREMERPQTTPERPKTAPVIPPMSNPFDNMPVGLKNMNIQLSKSFPSYPRENDTSEDFTKDDMPVGLKNMNIQLSKPFPSYPRENDGIEDFTKDETFENSNESAYEDDLRSRGIDQPQERSEKFLEWQQRLFNNNRFPRNWGPRTNFRPPMPPHMWPRNMQRPMNRWMGPPRPRFW